MVHWVDPAVSVAVLAQVKVRAYSAVESEAIDWGHPATVATVPLDHPQMPHQPLPQVRAGPTDKHVALVANRPMVHHRLQIECCGTSGTESICINFLTTAYCSSNVRFQISKPFSCY